MFEIEADVSIPEKRERPFGRQYVNWTKIETDDVSIPEKRERPFGPLVFQPRWLSYQKKLKQSTPFIFNLKKV